MIHGLKVLMVVKNCKTKAISIQVKLESQEVMGGLKVRLGRDLVIGHDKVQVMSMGVCNQSRREEKIYLGGEGTERVY